MAKSLTPACRVYAILARDGRSAVVFRRGPSRRVMLLRWWLDSDTIEPGQWLKGRIYERRCDLSPDGELLVYFATRWNGPIETWTAVSRPPYFTALALWPKGDAWGGGGLFLGPREIGLNHRDGNITLADGFALPKGVKVERYADYAGYGEDNPIEDVRLSRSGWHRVQAAEDVPYGATKGYSWKFDTPEILEALSPNTPSGGRPARLHRIIKAIGQRDGPWYVEDFIVRDHDGNELRRIVDGSWADWQANGDLLFGLEGKLYRLPQKLTSVAASDPLDGAKLVADLTGYVFDPQPPPKWATKWPWDR